MKRWFLVVVAGLLACSVLADWPMNGPPVTVDPNTGIVNFPEDFWEVNGVSASSTDEETGYEAGDLVITYSVVSNVVTNTAYVITGWNTVAGNAPSDLVGARFTWRGTHLGSPYYRATNLTQTMYLWKGREFPGTNQWVMTFNLFNTPQQDYFTSGGTNITPAYYANNGVSVLLTGQPVLVATNATVTTNFTVLTYTIGTNQVAQWDAASPALLASMSNRVVSLESKSNDWTTAYNWGDHSVIGYLTNEPIAEANSNNWTYAYTWVANNESSFSAMQGLSNGWEYGATWVADNESSVAAMQGMSNDWATAYSWGDHSTNGYLVSIDSSNDWNTAYGWGDHSVVGYLTVIDSSNDWNTAYGWGDHGTNGYLVSIGSSNDWNTAYGWGDHGTNDYQNGTQVALQDQVVYSDATSYVQTVAMPGGFLYQSWPDLTASVVTGELYIVSPDQKHTNYVGSYWTTP